MIYLSDDIVHYSV